MSVTLDLPFDVKNASLKTFLKYHLGQNTRRHSDFSFMTSWPLVKVDENPDKPNLRVNWFCAVYQYMMPSGASISFIKGVQPYQDDTTAYI